MFFIIFIILPATKLARSAVSQLAGIPQPFATWICCNGDFRVFLVFAVLCVVTFLIWYPFIKVWDNKCLKEEKGAEAELTKAVEREGKDILKF